MTVYRDERDTARAARRAAVGRLAAIGSDLAAIPGWLTVGPPSRLVDATERALADRAAELRAELDHVHRGIAALDAELDALDGPQTDTIHLFREWSRWLESLPDASTLLAQLVPDPRRLFLGIRPAMTLETAERMLDAVAANGGRVGSGDPFIAAADLVDDDVWDLVHTARRRLDPLPAGHVVGVLLPMRLETRYRRPSRPGRPWRLRIRVHPDPVALARPARPPNAEEARLVATCWTRAAGDLTTAAGAAAFRGLAAAVGGPRAAFVLRAVAVVPDGDRFVAHGTYDDPGQNRPDQRVALPDVLQVWGDSGSGLRLLGEMHPDAAAIAAQSALDETTMAGVRPHRIPSRWWTSYRAAVRVGLAREVPLPDGPHLDVLMVTGLSDRPAGEVFDALADRGELGVVTPMSPSNTVAGQPAADLGRDPATWLEVARTAGRGTASGLAGALTGRPRIDGVPAADTTLLEVVPALVAALWPPLWQRWLKDVEHAASIYELGDWAARLLSPLGAFPALRVGSVPYGVLPVGAVETWVVAPHDPVWEATIAAVARQLLPSWVAAGEAAGSAVGASAERLLDVIGRVPTSRELGTRQFVPLEALALVKSITIGADPTQVVADWETMAAPALAVEPRPHRRYQAFGRVQPPPLDSGLVAETLERYLGEPVETLAYRGRQQEVDEGVPLLVRLLRHSLLLTAAEASRLGEGFPSWTPPYEIPFHEPERLAQDAASGGPVYDLPDAARERLAEHPPDPRAVTVARQFLDVREAVHTLAGYDVALLPGGALHPAVAAVADTSSHRVDPWLIALPTRRLRRFDARDVPRRVGAYAWVDDLDPAEDPTPPTRAGLVHAPGSAQALAAAVLRDHAVTSDDPRWQIQIDSTRARLAARLGDDVRLGVHLSEALGREIERRAGDPGRVLELRRAFPARPEWKGRRVCDGQLVLAADPATLPADLELDDLRDVLDTYGDLLVADAVHEVVSGNAAAAQASMEAAAGLGAPPELRVLRTQRQGTSVRTTVLVALVLDEDVIDPASPITLADPALAALLSEETGPAEAWTWTSGTASCTLAELGLDVPDVVLHHQAELDALAAAALGGRPEGGSAQGRRRQLDRLCALVGPQDGLPDVAGPPDAATRQLRDRLAAVRTGAAALAGALAEDPPDLAAARRWGLAADRAADELAARVARAGDAASDDDADAATLGGRLRSLLAPASGLPLICTGTLPPLVTDDRLDGSWLEIVAAVRPAVARLEAHQLRTPWPGAATDPGELWATPTEDGTRHVVVYGPAAAAGGEVAVALLDDWAETIPGRRHTTHAAFGFDAPRARAPQSILLALPPDERVPLSAEALPDVILTARRLARARMAQPDGLGEWALAVPTSMFLTTGPAGSDLMAPT